MSWIVWEEQTCDQIDRLYRAIGSRVTFMVSNFVFKLWKTVSTDSYVSDQMQLRTVWMGRTIKLLDFIGKCHISLSGKITNQIRSTESTICLPCTVGEGCQENVFFPLFLACSHIMINLPSNLYSKATLGEITYNSSLTGLN